MLSAVAFVPQPPLLVPEVAQGAASELDDLRTACGQVLGRCLDDADEATVVGSVDGIEIASWLIQYVGWRGTLTNLVIDPLTPTSQCLEIGTSFECSRLVVAGDGSARRSQKAPGSFDDRAEDFDARVAVALAAGDPDGILELEAGLAGDLLVAGRAAWQVAAAAAKASDNSWWGSLDYYEFPYGVTYFAASWMRD